MQVAGGWLLQKSDDILPEELQLTVVTQKQPSEEDLTAARFAWRCVKHVKSNAITISTVSHAVACIKQLNGGHADKVLALTFTIGHCITVQLLSHVLQSTVL